MKGSVRQSQARSNLERTRKHFFRLGLLPVLICRKRAERHTQRPNSLERWLSRALGSGYRVNSPVVALERKAKRKIAESEAVAAGFRAASSSTLFKYLQTMKLFNTL
jgi:hypothetical protein